MSLRPEGLPAAIQPEGLADGADGVRALRQLPEQRPVHNDRLVKGQVLEGVRGLVLHLS